MKRSNKQFGLWLGLCTGLVALVVACGPANTSTKYNPAKAVYGQSSVTKTAATQLTWTIQPTAASSAWPATQWNGYIKAHLTVPNYTLTRLDVVPNQVLTVLTVKVSGDRYHYLIQTKEQLVKGDYLLIVNNAAIQSANDKINFSVTGLESNAGGDTGNYIPYPSTVKFFPNGVRVEIQDAELGVPSTVQFKISVPQSSNTTPADYIAIDTIYNTITNGAVNSGGGEAWYDSNYPYFGGGGMWSAPSSSKNMKLSPSLSAFPTDLSYGGIRSVLYNAFNPTTDLTTDPNLAPIHTAYSEALLGPTGHSMSYLSYSMVIYLKDQPEPYQPYKVYFTDNNGKSYDSPYFVPRVAFVSNRLNTYLSPKTSAPCFVSPSSQAMKCFGDNTNKQLGIDLPIASLPVYQSGFLPFGSVTDKVYAGPNAIASNAYATCVILNYDATAKTSETRCFGSNNKGGLGTGSSQMGPEIANTGTITLLPPQASNVLPFNTAVLNAQAVVANQDYFCALDFSNLVYCWGNTQVDNIISQPMTKEILINTGVRAKIIDFEVGNNPADCFVYIASDGNSRAACLSVSGGAGTTSVGTSSGKKIQNVYTNLFPHYFQSTENTDNTGRAGTVTPGFVDINLGTQDAVNQALYASFPNLAATQISVGQGHGCVLIADTAATAPSDITIPKNAFCWGEDYKGQFGSNIGFNRYDDAQRIGQIAPGTSTDPKDNIALSITAGSGITCVITQNYTLRCVGIPTVGTANNILAQTIACQTATVCPDFTKSNFDFGGYAHKVDVLAVSKGDYIVCANMRMTIEGQYQYAVKCWGQYSLNGHRLYSLSTTGNDVFFDYYPVIRW